jgi:hypothetical protein
VTVGAVAVIPHAGPDYIEAALSAGAVITERGGAMAHLANIGRERHILIVRLEGARRRFVIGDEVTVDAGARQVRLDRGPWRDISTQVTPQDDGWHAPDSDGQAADEHPLPAPGMR